MEVLNENFSFLVDRLVKFYDPAIQYKDPLKLPGLIGGKRRIFRATDGAASQYYKNFMIKAEILVVMKSKISIGGTNIPVTEFSVSHPDVKDVELGEVYPKKSYVCKVTSLEALQDKQTNRIYVDCNCPDFRFTFKEKLIDAGYTLQGSDFDPSLSKGTKALAPAICKHLYSIIMRKYALVIHKESDSDPEATTDAYMEKEKKPEPEEIEDEIPVFKSSPTTTPQVGPSPILPPAAATKLRPKAQYVQDLSKKIKDLDTQAEASANVTAANFMGSAYSQYYKDPHKKVSETYHSFKFRTRSFNGIWMIVYTNPSAFGAASTVVLPDSYKGNALEFYKLLQSYGLLRKIIEDNSTELPVELRDVIWQLGIKNKKIPGATQYTMMESIETDETELSSIASLLEEYY